MWQFEIPVVEYIRRRPVGCSADATETKPNQKDIEFKHTTSLLRCQGFQKKYKRPTKVVKAKPKAREPMM